ncbi:tetratricopeptide repeat protein [Mucilaginibacter sp. Mucisp86]|uniref:tetratricopeptide repeat protein n=1 Tax=Mucilaginibacter sp. Mucisp86 TaxID=3243060 RepID=UPI0039B39C99
MEYRKLAILFALLFAALVNQAQENSPVVPDSTVDQLYNAGNWKQLISFAKKSVTDSTDSPDLRFKVGYAYMLTGNYKAAISQFNQVLLREPQNSTARLYAYYCNTYINNNSAAFYNAAHLDKETQNGIKLSPFGLNDVALESGIKLPANDERDNGFFERAGIGLRLSWRLQLDQSFMFFKQNIFRAGFIDYKNQVGKTDKQTEYYVRAKYSLAKNISLLSAYHYLHTSYRSNVNQSNLGLFGVKYDTRYIDLQGDINWGKLIDKTLKQYDAKIDFYPLGNLNLYTMSRASLLNLSGTKTFIYSQSVGFKVVDKTWLETAATFGNQDDYLDADGLYVYNSIDPTKFKCGESVFYQLGNHALLNLNYFYEKKTDIYRAVKYNQNSVTLGITWKF